MTTFGAGFELDENLDLVVSPAGDLSTVDGLDELKKDLSYRLNQTLETRLGQPLSHDYEEQLKAIVRGVLLDDPRVEDVSNIQIEPAPGVNNHLTITIDAVTADGPFEQILTV